MSTQSQNGKAYEWAVAISINAKTNFPIVDNKSAQVSRSCFELIDSSKRQHYIKAAETAINHILSKENQQLINKKCCIKFNTDSNGQNGDVRDLIIEGDDFSIGISCKTNHSALKHSRLSRSIDFIKKWNLSEQGCSVNYWTKINPLFIELQNIKNNSKGSALWNCVEDVPGKYYWPILHAFSDEIIRLQNTTNDTKSLCENFIKYIIGRNDFYKIIAGKKIIEIQAFNFNGTLLTQKSKFPDRIICIDDLNGGKYSKTVRFNYGYTINFRIHNASSRVEPSLKFDINAISLPAKNIYIHKIEL